MKVLFFHAVAGQPRFAPPLMGQVADTLRPFNRFLGQAVHTARERQSRYALPWERVRDLSTLRLEPLDTRIRVPRRPPGTVIVGWPADRTPDCEKLAFSVDRSLPIRVLAATPSADGLRVRTDVPLQPDERMLWCGQECRIAVEAAPAPPTRVLASDGQPVPLFAPTTPLDDHWCLHVEGRFTADLVVVDGEAIEPDVLPAHAGVRRLLDAAGRSIDWTGELLRVEELPAAGPLRADNGVRFAWHETGQSQRAGLWLQLLPSDGDEEDLVDPRVAFCEDDVDEVWTSRSKRKDEVYRVKRVDRERYQLLVDRLPPEGSTLHLPVDVRNLQLQRRALRQLMEAPLPHHQGLLRLCEDPRHACWPGVTPRRPDRWCSLVDDTRSGTDEQRSFVAKALGSPDFAFLEGPPGSGKTTAICEIVQQLIADGQRVLLCASTHVAIDNVLERLLASDSPVDAVRIGKADKVDDKVLACQLDERIDALVRRWRDSPDLAPFAGELREMAERTVIMAANLTCGTTMGIVSHPLFRDRDLDMKAYERPITTMPHWDVLIVDEASKTLIQEFMVPALMARRWTIVGDVRQLPPFADRADIVANLRDLIDAKERSIFPRDHQRACLLLFRLLRRDMDQPGLRWLIAEPPGVLDCIVRELAEQPEDDLTVVRVAARAGREPGPVPVVTLADLAAGAPPALRLAAADWVLVGDDLLAEASRFLPANLLTARDLTAGKRLAEGDVFLCRQARWLSLPRGELSRTYRGDRKAEIRTLADAQRCEQTWLHDHDLAGELAWRLTRLHELRHSRHDDEPKRLRKALERLLPRAVDIRGALAEIEDIGLPSILEVLQEGIGVERSDRPSALTAGLSRQREVFQARFESLSFQHRMHPQIADFSRDIIYHGRSLKDANTIQIRDADLGWSFGAFRSRRVWADVRGHEHAGENQEEVRAIEAVLRRFIAWAAEAGPPRRFGAGVWEVACLCFYVKQERALSAMLRRVTQDDRQTRFAVRGAPIEIVCGTVDRFQGREADLVLLSMRNTARVGFLDSPNRLNVAVTRARQQLVVVGNADYFRGCKITELEELVRRSAPLDMSNSNPRNMRSRR